MSQNKTDGKVTIMVLKKKTLLIGIICVLCFVGAIAAAAYHSKKDKTPDSMVAATAEATDAVLTQKVQEENEQATIKPTKEPAESKEVEATPVIVDNPTDKPIKKPEKTMKPQATKAPEKETPAPSKLPSSKRQFVVVIDPGHQIKQNSAQEAVAPGSKKTKKKVSSGTAGTYTGVAEYQVNLEVSLQLRDALEQLGYTVIMTRETNDVDISNIERAEVANKAKADVFIRIHCDGSEDHSVNGIFTICPTKNNPNCSGIYKECYALSKCVLDDVIDTTDANSRGIMQTDTMSGINWCQVPVTIIEMGYMSNKKEDNALVSKDYQKKLVEGMSKGIQKYLESK
ncbi:MAG: N-acetylmuramoyl-L-alanine amidase [bacterium]|nr:N-acetylmuramoyl-L-alanine amidase [bacterium]